MDPGFVFHSPMFFLRNPPKTILTPCIGICTLAPDGYCVGCHRTGVSESLNHDFRALQRDLQMCACAFDAVEYAAPGSFVAPE